MKDPCANCHPWNQNRRRILRDPWSSELLAVSATASGTQSNGERDDLDLKFEIGNRRNNGRSWQPISVAISSYLLLRFFKRFFREILPRDSSVTFCTKRWRFGRRSHNTWDAVAVLPNVKMPKCQNAKMLFASEKRCFRCGGQRCHIWRNCYPLTQRILSFSFTGSSQGFVVIIYFYYLWHWRRIGRRHVTRPRDPRSRDVVCRPLRKRRLPIGTLNSFELNYITILHIARWAINFEKCDLIQIHSN